MAEEAFGKVIQPQETSVISGGGGSPQPAEAAPSGNLFATAPTLASPLKGAEIASTPDTDEETEMSITDVIKKIVIIEEPPYKNSFMSDDLFAPDDDADIAEWWDDYVRTAFTGFAQGSPSPASKRRGSSQGDDGGTRRGSPARSPGRSPAKSPGKSPGKGAGKEQRGGEADSDGKNEYGVLVEALGVNDPDGFMSLIPEGMLDRIARETGEKDRWKRHVETLRKAHEVEKLNMQIIAESRAKEKIKGEIDKVQRCFDQELIFLKEQYTEMRLSIIKKDKMIKKMADLVVKQEEMLTEYRLVIEEKRKKEGGGMFSHREDTQEDEEKDDKKKSAKQEKPKIPTLREVTGNATPPKEKKRKKAGGDQYEGIDVEMLLHEVETANELSKFYIRDYEILKKKLLDLQKEMEETLKRHEEKVARMKAKFAEREDELKAKIVAVRREFEIFKLDINREVDVKEIIINRQLEYIEVLKRELVLAKNIIKNPRLFDKATMKMNYKILDLYPIGQKDFARSQAAQCGRTAIPGRYPETEPPPPEPETTFLTGGGGVKEIVTALPSIEKPAPKSAGGGPLVAIDRTRLPAPASMTDGFTNFSSPSGTHADILSPGAAAPVSHFRHSSVGAQGQRTGGLPSVPESRRSKAVLNETMPL